MKPNAIKIETTVNAPVSTVWQHWTDPVQITKWNSPSPEWHTPQATNDLKAGGNFTFRMEARDGSAGFDFGGVYDEVVPNEKIFYTLEDGRQVEVLFKTTGNATHVTETFDPEDINPLDMQRAGWQAILDNFKKHVESAQV
jgi:uncharacterized protein YndB with AHSA1/START domain